MSFAVPRGAAGFDAWDSYIKREAPAPKPGDASCRIRKGRGAARGRKG